MNAALALAPSSDAAQPRLQFLTAPGDPVREYFLYLPDGLQPGAEPLVLAHGISRNAAEMALRFAELAARHRVPLIAPLFQQHSFGQYQQLADRRRGLRSDHALIDILADASRRFGLETGRIALFGFSGGAQFAHRFAMVHPQRVRVCVPASAGWYTMPDPVLHWPLGLGNMPDGALDPAVGEVPFHLIVGQRDTGDHEALRQDPELNAIQGVDRRTRARTWRRALKAAGWQRSSSLTVLPQTRHSFACAYRHGLVETVFRLIGYEGEVL